MQGLAPKRWGIYWLLGALLCACQPSPALFVDAPPTNPTVTNGAPQFVFAAANDAIPQLVVAERTAANQRDLTLLTQLWAEDARIIDGRNSGDAADDYIWKGRAAILDRYQIAVFPNPPPLREQSPKLNLRLENVKNEHTSASAQDMENGDQWEFVFREGRWWLLVLRYGFNPP